MRARVSGSALPSQQPGRAAQLVEEPAWAAAENDMEKQFNSFLFVDTIIPCLRQIDLINDRTESWYQQLGVMQMASAA